MRPDRRVPASCRLCGSRRVAKKFTIPRRADNHKAFDIFECAECAFQFRDIPERDAYKFYHEGYYKGKAAFAYLDERQNEPASRVVWKARMERLMRRDHARGGKCFLDVGCSFGGLMQVAKEQGYEPYGAEVSRYSGKYAQGRFGKDRVFIGNIEALKLPKDKFSIVTMIEVIEHLFRPTQALKNLYGSMKKGGVLLVQTADMSGLQAKMEKENYHYYLPGHLSCFTRANLVNELKKAGFKKVRVIGGVEFGLLPKLIKSRSGFKKMTDYLSWIRIAVYHLLSRMDLTSSMVVLAWK